MTSPLDAHEIPPELEDAMARIEQAKDNYAKLPEELHRFLYNYVKGMVKGFDNESGDFVVQLRHPKESNIKGKPRVLVSQIVENLRTALDYMIYELSVLNEPKLDKRSTQFPISDTESKFKRQAKKQLRYLTEEQKSFVERLQPYHGNGMLALLGEMTNVGKHRRLLSIQDMTSLHIIFAKLENKGKYKDYFVYPVEKGHAIFAKPKGRGQVLLMDKYDGMLTLQELIAHIEAVLCVSFCFFQGRPLHLNIVYC